MPRATTIKNPGLAGDTILIWDSDQAVPSTDALTVLWRGSAGAGTSDAVSVLELVEQDADALRARYLAWIHDLGELPVGGRSVVGRLTLRPGFSAWWMTDIAYKANAYTAPYITDVIKLLAFENLVRSRGCRRITLRSSNAHLAQVLADWCRRMGAGFDWSRYPGAEPQAPWRSRLQKALPDPIQAILWLLRHLWRRRAQRQSPAELGRCLDGEVSIVDYLINFDGKAAAEGRFVSGYWTRLADLLDRGDRRVTWLHHYFEHDALPNACAAQDLMTRLNEGATRNCRHLAVDSVLSPEVVIGALRDYGRLLWLGGRCRAIGSGLRPTGSAVNPWPFYEREWRRSLRGIGAMRNCLFLNLFESIARRLPRQRLGIFIQENQPWEMAFIHAWKGNGHGHLVGVPHTTVRYWDMRYFHDPRSYRQSGANHLPLPDFVAVNGPAARSAMLTGGYPADRLIEVEALRFLHLCDLPSHTWRPRQPDLPLEVLVLGDYVPAVNRHQMRLLEVAAGRLPAGTRFVVKPHPACPIDLHDYPLLNADLASAPLPQLLAACDVVFTSNATSAAVDAYCTGVSVVSVLDTESLNLSPLRGVDGVTFVATPVQLAEALRGPRTSNAKAAAPFFRLDAGLPAWRNLLGLDVPYSSEANRQ